MTSAPAPPRTIPDPQGEASEVAVFARGGAAMFGSFIVQGLLQFALVLVVTHLLARGEAGAFLEAVALFMIASQLGAFGADSGIVRTIPRLRVHGHQGEVRTSIAASLVPVGVVGVVVGIVVFAVAGPLSGAVFDPSHRATGANELRLIAVFIPAAVCATVVLAAARSFGRVTYFAAQNAAVATARPLLVAAVALVGLGPGGIAVAWAAPTVASLAGGGILLRRDLRALGHELASAGPGRPWAVVAREFWSYSLPRALASVFTVTVTWLDVLLVGRLASTVEAGIYGVASRLYVVGSYGLQAVGVAAAPQFSHLLAAGRRRELERLYQVGTWWTMAFSWPFYAFMLVFPATMMRALFGGSYADGGRALAVLGFAGLLDVGTGNSQALLLMSGYSKLYAANTGVAVALNIGLNVALVPRMGITGAAIAWAVSIAVTNLAALIECRLLMGMRPFGPGYPVVAAGAIACFLVLPLVVRTLAGAGIPAFLAAAALALATYAAVLWRFRTLLDLDVLWAALRNGHPGRA